MSIDNVTTIQATSYFYPCSDNPEAYLRLSNLDEIEFDELHCLKLDTTEE